LTRVVAPASTANLGPGFDAAAAALDLWNEVVVEEGPFAVEVEGEGAEVTPRDLTHLSLRAFGLYASPERFSFRFVNRIPYGRGLGSSAAAIALGLVAGAAAAGRLVTPDELLAAGKPLEGHCDNLAAALFGGVCFTWQRNGSPRAQRVAADMPAAAVLAVPVVARTSTVESRTALPYTIRHDDAVVTAGAAAMLGAAIASGDVELLRDAMHDRLHEQYRLAGAPLLQELRAHAPAGAVGVTLSGSGPSVVVWADKRRTDEVAAALRHSLSDDTNVLPLRVAEKGAHLVGV
jgi:homoserine kinase